MIKKFENIFYLIEIDVLHSFRTNKIQNLLPIKKKKKLFALYAHVHNCAKLISTQCLIQYTYIYLYKRRGKLLLIKILVDIFFLFLFYLWNYGAYGDVSKGTENHGNPSNGAW